jgi:hypothetical protein
LQQVFRHTSHQVYILNSSTTHIRTQAGSDYVQTDYRIPAKMQKTTLVIKVKKGNSVFKGIRLMAYLAIAPTAPPSATNKKFMVVISYM